MGPPSPQVHEEVLAQFRSWKKKLGKKAAEAGIAAEAFYVVHLPDRARLSKDFMIFMMYTFFRQYLTLPENQKQQLEPLALEAKQIVDKLVATA